MDACEILHTATECIGDRAKERDMPSGERSMLRTVAAFEAITKIRLTEVQGWIFMAALKLSRAQAGAHRLDDYIDGAAYVSLAGEAAERGLCGEYVKPMPAEIAGLAAALIEAAERDE